MLLFLLNKEFTDINPVVLGQEACEPGHFFGPAMRNYFLIHYVCRGEGTFKNSTGEYHLKKGDIFVIVPDEITVYEADKENPWEYIWIGFTGKAAERLSELPERVLHYGENTFFSMLYAEQLKNTREEFLAGKIFELLSVIFEGEKVEVDYVKQAQNYINVRFMTELTAESVAKTIGVSRRYLSRLFKAKTGGGLQKYIINARIENAKKMLSNGASVSEAAHFSGFNDMFNFSKTFKKETGMPPSEYKKEFKTKYDKDKSFPPLNP